MSEDRRDRGCNKRSHSQSGWNASWVSPALPPKLDEWKRMNGKKINKCFLLIAFTFFKFFPPIQWPPASSYNNQLVTQSLSIQHPNLWVPTFNQCIGHRVEGNLPPNNRSLTRTECSHSQTDRRRLANNCCLIYNVAITLVSVATRLQLVSLQLGTWLNWLPTGYNPM